MHLWWDPAPAATSSGPQPPVMHVGGPDGEWECNVRSVARFTLGQSSCGRLPSTMHVLQVLVDPEAAAQSKMRKQLQQRRELKMECARLCSAAASRRACQVQAAARRPGDVC